ncbi:apolipoprotein N-acyltransferase [Sphingopyxis sp. XHP0097]|uniref:Apolipoprotein N-acyltransferase n=1 Tax=Sphingopyxis jiangsuensis TaxID=2871171 RepID=A0ABS7MF20_9SPHN|nr:MULTISPECIES: apolipoprotein N-acyltransferase [Sphingopyxis]MBY4637630.1 apolipoprotein N-acyltransferase [Sphingopyxis jiangsuensis]
MTALLPRFAQFVDRWPSAIALILGAVSATGFAPLGLWPLTLAALAGWMAIVARAASGWRALGAGWAFGVGHFLIGLNWIATAFTYQAAMPAWLGWIAVLLLALYLAVYPALAAWGAWAVQRFVAPAKGGGRYAIPDTAGVGMALSSSGKPSVAPAFAGATLSYILAFAGLWTLTEWLRSWVFTGFAWNPLIAASPGLARSVVPSVDLLTIVGSYGASALLILAAGFFVPIVHETLFASEEERETKRQAKLDEDMRGAPLQSLGWPPLRNVMLGLLYVGILYGLAQFARGSAAVRNGGVPVTLVQPNIGQADKWEGDKADANFAKLARLTAPESDTPRLVLWPEAAIPDYLEWGYPAVYYDRSPLEARARLVQLMNPGDVMLLGALKLELDKSGDVVGARNAVMTVHADGTLGPRYDKAHLVPYGEYLPMRPLLSAIGLSRLVPGDIDFWPGPGPRTFDLARFGQVGLQICYEIIFSGQVVDRANRPDFIFNPSNDAWFGAWGPPQHLAQARLRAIEEGLPVVRSTPTGISAIIDADGRIVDSIPMHRAGRIDAMLPPPHAPTLFARYGNALPVGFALLLLALAIAIRRRGR